MVIQNRLTENIHVVTLFTDYESLSNIFFLHLWWLGSHFLLLYCTWFVIVFLSRQQLGQVSTCRGGHSQPLPQQEDDLLGHREEEIDPSDVAQSVLVPLVCPTLPILTIPNISISLGILRNQLKLVVRWRTQAHSTRGLQPQSGVFSLSLSHFHCLTCLSIWCLD